METKTCTRCEQLKPHEQFSRRRAEKDGRDYYCKECRRYLAHQLAEDRTRRRAEGLIHLADTKTCKGCGKTKPLMDFPIQTAQEDGHHWLCFDCKRSRERAYGRRYREKHPEQKRQSGRKYARKDEVRQLRSELMLKAKYGLTPEAFSAKLAAQGGKCPFCADGTEVEKWDVDHDHYCCPDAQTCGRCLRDILCHKHNIGLGYWDDDPERLREAADYIEAWRAIIKPEARAARPQKPRESNGRPRKPLTMLPDGRDSRPLPGARHDATETC
jgi:Recombination endonuclease VII